MYSHRRLRKDHRCQVWEASRRCKNNATDRQDDQWMCEEHATWARFTKVHGK